MIFRHYKGEPGLYVIRYRNGKVVRHGPGLAFWYRPFNTSVALVPSVTQEAPFIFNEATVDFQEVSIQGTLTFRLTDPLAIAKHLDFTVDPRNGRYRTKDLEKLAQRVVNAVQANTRSGVNTLSLEAALIRVKELAGKVLTDVRKEPDLVVQGVEVESLHFTAVQATPEMRKALEADYREGLQQRADQAIYARRKAALEEENKISHRELDTEVELEERRRDLVTTQASNRLQEAETEAKAIELETLAKVKGDEITFKLYQSLSPQALLGLALKEWGAKAQIGNLSVTPDMIGQLVQWAGKGQA
ncbi:SPFH domain-containing protein [Petrachloros mirabilis]